MVDTSGKCFKCSKKTNILNPGLICKKCKKVFHGECLVPTLDSFQMKTLAEEGWFCKKCARNEEKSTLRSTVAKRELVENQRQLDINQELKSLLELAEMSLDELLERHNKLIMLNKVLNQENLILARRLAHLDGTYKMKVEFLEKITQRKAPTVKVDYIQNALKMAKARDELAGTGEDNVTKDFNTFAKYAGLKKHETWAFILQGKIKKMSKSWFTHFALFFIIIIYTCIGAVIFQILEGNIPLDEPMDKSALAKEFSTRLDNNIKKFGSFNNTGQTNAYQQHVIGDMQQFEAMVRKRYEYQSRMDRGTEELNWGFYSSAFFCSTVYTTIGYGLIYPITLWGQIAVIIYATIGIPLFLITLADFGALLTRHLKYIWNCPGRRSRKDKVGNNEEQEKQNENEHALDDKVPIVVAMSVLLIYLVVGAIIFTVGEPWSYLDSMYFLFISITTVGYGDFVPKVNWYLFLYMLYLFLGLAIATMALNVVREKMIYTMDKTSAKFGHTLDIYIDEINI